MRYVHLLNQVAVATFRPLGYGVKESHIVPRTVLVQETVLINGIVGPEKVDLLADILLFFRSRC